MDHLSGANSDEKAAFWASGIWQTKETKDFGRNSGYDVDTTGLAFGLDVPQRDITYGAAFTAQKGDVDAHHSATSSEIETYGISFYAKKRFENGAFLTGGLSWLSGTHKMTQHNLMRFEGKADAESVIGSLQTAHDFGFALNDEAEDALMLKLRPFIGVEAQYARADGFTTRVDGADSFSYGSQSGWVFRVPVGVTAGFSKENAAEESRW